MHGFDAMVMWNLQKQLLRILRAIFWTIFKHVGHLKEFWKILHMIEQLKYYKYTKNRFGVFSCF
jgi:hypothetical protein